MTRYFAIERCFRIAPPHRTRRNADALLERLRMRQQPFEVWLHVFIRKPSERRDKRPRASIRLLCRPNYLRHTAVVAAFPCQDRRWKHLRRTVPSCQLGGARLPAEFTGDAQAVEVGVDLLVELGQIVERLVGAAGGTVALQPQDGGILRVLQHDAGNCRSHGAPPCPNVRRNVCRAFTTKTAVGPFLGRR
jgi:hypothetical protein